MDYQFSVNANEYLPLRDVVFHTLRNAILTGKLVPGERLMENQLAEKLGVSRTPVREALRMLEIENLVELVPRKGAQVLDISENDIINVLEVRSVLEGLGVELACKRMSTEQLEKLKLAQKNFEKACDTHSLEQMAETDEKFHEIIFDASQNVKLIQIINNLKIQLYRYRIAHLKIGETKSTVNDHHYAIIHAIEQHASKEGIEAAKKHVQWHTEFILNSLRKKV